MSAAPQLDLFISSLPRRPYCTDNPDHGLKIRDAATALGYRYIQPNAPNSRLWLLFDIDRVTSIEEITGRGLPPPTMFVAEPLTYGGHAFYGLEMPVHLNPTSSHKAVRFAGAVDVAMTHALDADPGYASLIAKNPRHRRWRTYATGEVYSLNEIAEHLDLSSYADRRKNLPAVGLGRNCTLFDRIRSWAYRAIRQGWPAFDRWHMAVLERARAYNDFSTPLHESEVRATAKSVAKWTHRHFSPSAFSDYQAAVGRKGGTKSGEMRRSASEHHRATARLLAARGASQRAIANELGVNQATVSRWLKG